MLGLRRSQPHRYPNPRGVGSGSQIGMTGLYVVEHKMICIFFFSLKSNNSQVLPVLRGKERKNKTKLQRRLVTDLWEIRIFVVVPVSPTHLRTEGARKANATCRDAAGRPGASVTSRLPPNRTGLWVPVP